jgi:hypothetical protein
VSPLRFLTAVRLYMAKQLLLTTSLTVADIACRVGYSSVGTFTTRFTESVGVSPTRFRRLASIEAPDVGRARSPEATEHSWVVGLLTTPDEIVLDAPIYVGVFPTPIAQGEPESCAVLTEPGPWRLAVREPGTWYVLAATAATAAGARGTDRVQLVTSHEVTIGPVPDVHYAELRLRAPQRTDAPVLLALPGLDAPQVSEQRNRVTLPRASGLRSTRATRAAL